jgi:predicted dehydrogenase (TIGR03970 family)
MDRHTIVVGAGTAGAALAARLSEDPEHHVTLLEAGPAPRSASGFPPGLLDASTVEGAMPGHPANWSYLGQLTPDRPYTIARGRIAGGSSTINGGYFIRARPEDFARWARAAGPDWEYERVLPVLCDLERDLDLGGGAFHGDAGPMPVRRASQRNPVARAFAAAARELGFPEEPDKNAPGPPGVGPLPRNVVGGRRVNTALAYLEPARERANLEVMGGCFVRRVVFDGSRAIGVEVEVADEHDEGRRVIAADEVVLCAGGIGTPHLLLVSGAGPAEQMRALGIDVVRDAPGVGRAFSDHPDLSIGWRASRDIVDPDTTETFTTALNLASDGGPGPGDLEIMACVTTMGRLLTGSASTETGDLFLLVGLQHELARGSITLESADPAAPPRIEYRYLSNAHDLARVRLGVRTAVALLRSRAFAGLFERLTELDDATLDDDAALDAWMLAHLGTAIHLCGSAPMGSADDPNAVADGFGRVHGVHGLRIADTSMLPNAPSRGPANTAVLIGELVARFIRRGD